MHPTEPPTTPRDLADLARGQDLQDHEERGGAYDPLKLCIFATIALLGWLAGPFALLLFAGLGFAGYWRARRAGLRTSRCLLRDTRLVLAYLAVLVLAAGWGIWRLLG